MERPASGGGPDTLPAARSLTSLPGLAATEPGYARCTAVADWDGDGDDDVALVYMTRARRCASVRGADPVKVTPINASLFVPPVAAVTDADDDGAPDLVWRPRVDVAAR